jgi:hypothetical protein
VKIVAVTEQISGYGARENSRFLVEVTNTELDMIEGRDRRDRGVGQTIDMHTHWQILREAHDRKEQLARGSKLLRSIADQIDFANDALHPKPLGKDPPVIGDSASQ